VCVRPLTEIAQRLQLNLAPIRLHCRLPCVLIGRSGSGLSTYTRMSYHLKQRPLPSGKGYRKIRYHRSPDTRSALGLGDQVGFPGSPESDCHVDDLFDFVQYDEDGGDPMSPISRFAPITCVALWTSLLNCG
jgi:hypothetical protein